MTKQMIKNGKTFEDYLLENFNRNEGKYFTKEELINSYKEQTESPEFLRDSFEESIIFINNSLSFKDYFVEEKQLEGSEELLYAKMPIDNPVSKSIIPTDILPMDYFELTRTGEQIALDLVYHTPYWQLMESKEALKLLSEQYGIEKRTIMKMGLGLNENVLSIPVFNYSTVQYPAYERPEVMNIKYISLDDNSSKYYEPQTISQLAMINSLSLLTSVIVVVKDYFQGFQLWQFLNSEGLGAFYHIVLSPDSLDSLAEQMSDIELNKYKTFYLNIGSGNKADEVSDEILSKYPMFKRIIYE